MRVRVSGEGDLGAVGHKLGGRLGLAFPAEASECGLLVDVGAHGQRWPNPGVREGEDEEGAGDEANGHQLLRDDRLEVPPGARQALEEQHEELHLH